MAGNVFELNELNNNQSSNILKQDFAMPGAFLSFLVHGAKEGIARGRHTNHRGTQGWQAMCLRVTTFVPSRDNAFRELIQARNLNKGISTNSSEIFMSIKAYIPDLDALSPLPRTLPAYHVEHEDHDWISRFFPTDFYAPYCSQQLPSLGELIWVDYRNVDKRQGGIYNGRVDSKNPQIFFPNSGPLESPKDAFEQAETPASVTV